MAILSNLDLIRRVPLFALLPEDQAQLIADAVTKKRFKRGQNLVEQGKNSGALLIILSGRARVVLTNDLGREVILARVAQGDCIGEMSLIDGEAHSATVTAEVQLDALVLGRQAFSRCLSTSSLLAEAVMRSLVQRLRNADRKIESLALLDVYGRVARALIEMADRDSQGQLVIAEKISRQDIAKSIGASREMVSRVMQEVGERDYLEEASDGSIVIHDHLMHKGLW